MNPCSRINHRQSAQNFMQSHMNDLFVQGDSLVVVSKLSLNCKVYNRVRILYIFPQDKNEPSYVRRYLKTFNLREDE